MPIPADPAAPENSAANNPMAWLENFERDFGMLPLEEKEAIKDFCLLWSVCEGQFLNRNANTKKIRGAVNKLAKRGHLSLEAFRDVYVVDLSALFEFFKLGRNAFVQVTNRDTELFSPRIPVERNGCPVFDGTLESIA